MVESLATRAAGLEGDAAAQARLAEVQAKVVVPLDAAISEFRDVEVPPPNIRSGAGLNPLYARPAI